MRLADEIVIDLRSRKYRLCPTLRAAARLHAEYGGYAEIIEQITEGSFEVVLSIIRECSDGTYQKVTANKDAFAGMSMQSALASVSTPLIRLILRMAGIEDGEQPKQSGKPISFAEYHQQLFQIATGWLGWSPETAWNSTPAEILAARAGRVEMLKAIFGSAEEDKGPNAYDEGFLDHAGVAELKAMAANARSMRHAA